MARLQITEISLPEDSTIHK